MNRTSLQHAAEDAKQALVYVRAAQRLVGPTVDFLTDLPMLAPASFLVAHAVELSLTAYLRASGRKGRLSNHSLIERLTAAEEIGFRPSAKFKKCVTAIHPSHIKMQFRYSKDNPEGFMTPSDILEHVLPDLQDIERYVWQKATG